MENNTKIVDFSKCKTCKHENIPDWEEPCRECLLEPARDYSHTPINWEDKDAK